MPSGLESSDALHWKHLISQSVLSWLFHALPSYSMAERTSNCQDISERVLHAASESFLLLAEALCLLAGHFAPQSLQDEVQHAPPPTTAPFSSPHVVHRAPRAQRHDEVSRNKYQMRPWLGPKWLRTMMMMMTPHGSTRKQ